jgi:hypothetical protein
MTASLNSTEAGSQKAKVTAAITGVFKGYLRWLNH